MRPVALLLMLALVTACGDGEDQGACAGAKLGNNSLDGSYCEGLDLLFTSVRIKSQTSGDTKFITVDYLLSDAMTTTPQKTLTILFEATSVMIETNKMIPILDANGVVRRIDRNMTINLTDELEPSSQLTFTAYSDEIGSNIAGDFGFLFKNGRTLLGTFEGSLVDALDTVGN